MSDVKEIQELRNRQYGVSADSLASGKTLVVEDKGPVSINHNVLSVRSECGQPGQREDSGCGGQGPRKYTPQCSVFS